MLRRDEVDDIPEVLVEERHSTSSEHEVQRRRDVSIYIQDTVQNTYLALSSTDPFVEDSVDRWLKKRWERPISLWPSFRIPAVRPPACSFR